MDVVETFLAKKYSNNPEIEKSLTDLYLQYKSWGLKDNKFDQDFTDGRDEHFFAYLWEMLLARHLKDIGLDISSADEGPDFKIYHEGQTIWVEAICPSPERLPDEWLKPKTEGETLVTTFPYEQILLRWTAALKEKKEKLTGRTERDHEVGRVIRNNGYLKKGIVGNTEAYVVAVSACRLGHGDTFLHYDISQKPFALTTAFPIGPIELTIDRASMQTINQGYAHRPIIKNPNEANVPTDSFLNPDYAHVSAILGTPAGLNAACGDKSPIAVVHNPLAINKLPIGILGADEEYIAEDKGDHYEIRMVSKSG